MAIDDLRSPHKFEQMNNGEHVGNASDKSNQAALVPSVRVDQVIGARDHVMGLVEQGMAMLRAADTLSRENKIGELWEEICKSFTDLRFHCSDTDRDGWQIRRIRAALEANAWNSLLWDTGLRRFMDGQSRSEWDEAVQKRTTPVLDIDTVQATFLRLYEDRGEMVEQAVIQLFRSLSWNFKSHLPIRFGKRLILEGAYHEWKGPRHYPYENWTSHSRTYDRIDDLLRQLRYFDGLSELKFEEGPRPWIRRNDLQGAPWEPYFELRRFKNGNAHIIFKREDLIDKLNSILAKHFPGALPAPSGAK